MNALVTPKGIDGFEVRTADSVASVQQADLKRVAEQIKLCQHMAEATKQLAEDCAANPSLYATPERRTKIAKTVIGALWENIDYKSMDAFCDDTRTNAFHLSKPKFIYYYFHGHGPSRRNIASFMNAMIGAAAKAETRLLEENPEVRELLAQPTAKI
ncbi:MAG: hypothetical protein HRT94_00690 [Alphaproteobacteria bacterium]|nr:hypothetical protein [Alphaproteobacteria bacterium]